MDAFIFILGCFLEPHDCGLLSSDSNNRSISNTNQLMKGDHKEKKSSFHNIKWPILGLSDVGVKLAVNEFKLGDRDSRLVLVKFCLSYHLILLSQLVRNLCWRELFELSFIIVFETPEFLTIEKFFFSEMKRLQSPNSS